MKSSRTRRSGRLQALVPALILLFLTTFGTAQPQTAEAPVAGVHEAGLTVAMRDGAELALDLYRQDPPLPRPTLLAAGPLPLVVDGGMPDSPHTGPLQWWIEQGFNVVLMSTRGTGNSGGDFEFMGREEQQDHYEIIEWIAAQSWSDGQVAGLGAGYYGTSQWFMAIQNPPHLACIAPVSAVLDPYADWFMPGGLANDSLLDWYETEVREAWAWPLQGAAQFVDFDLQRQLLEHRLPDAWWDLRTPLAQLGQVQTAVFQAGSWRQQDPHWSHTLRRIERLPRNTFTWVGNNVNLLQDRNFLENELLPWYRWCFAGKPRSGPALQPALRYQVVNSSVNRASSGWPPANINFTPLYAELTNADGHSGRLLTEPGEAGRNRTPLQDAGSAISIELRSAALATAVDLAGPLLVQFHASAATLDAAFEAELYEEVLEPPLPRPDAVLPGFLNPGPSRDTATPSTRLEQISSGRLKASLRSELESPDSQPQAADPMNPALLYPGRIYRFDLQLAARAWRLRAGSRLVLKLRPVEDPSLKQLARNDTLYHTRQYPTRLWLPLSADARLEFRAEQGSPVDGLDATTRELFEGDNPVILLRSREAQEDTAPDPVSPDSARSPPGR